MNMGDRHIVVTGGASGIGRAAVAMLLARGAKVGVLDLDADGMRDLAWPERCWTFACDVRSEAGVDAAMAAAAAAMGAIDGVVNSAGIANGSPFEQTDFATWKAVIDTNLHGTFLVCKAATRWLREAPSASIVNIASAQALLPTGSSSSYTASKGGVVAFSKTIAIELAPRIRVNVVCPGTTRTPMVDELMALNPETIRRNLAPVPMSRLAEPAEISELICFLLGEQSSFINGAAIPIDGGRTRH